MSNDGLYLGLMSGTSLDAIDCALVQISKKATTLRSARSTPIAADLRAELFSLCSPGDNEIDRMGIADRRLGRSYAEAVNALLSDLHLSASSIRAIGCHGQTIRHRPSAGQRFTLQIGDPNALAVKTGITVVSDFRRRDMAVGGQGAPLAPAFHQAVFADDDEPRAIVNIGGISNITLLTPGQPVIGFDTGPGNVLMDGWTLRHRQVDFDRDGAWAAQGHHDDTLLQRLLSHSFLSQLPPKSTGREEFSGAWLDEQLIDGLERLAPVDVQATLLEFTARTVTSDLLGVLPADGAVYLCGGGAHNVALRRRIEMLLEDHRISTTSALGIDPDWVEAAAFAWLAYRTLSNLTGNLPAVTGASRDVVLGGIYQV